MRGFFMAEIQLANSDDVSLVDDDKADWVKQWTWRLWTSGRGRLKYAVRYEVVNGKNTAVLLHRALLGLTDRSVVVDHRNSNGLDNRGENLRACLHAENMRNRRRNANSKTGFKGVTVRNSCPINPFRAQIQFDGKRHDLGSFKTAEEAHAAYVGAAQRLHGDFARFA